MLENLQHVRAEETVILLGTVEQQPERRLENHTVHKSQIKYALKGSLDLATWRSQEN
jgi:hypothetical protein